MAHYNPYAEVDMTEGDPDLREDAPAADAADEHRSKTTISEAQIGSEPEIRQLYRQDISKPWKEWKEGEDPDIGKHSESLKYALVVRRERSRELDEGLSLHSITIQSPVLRKLLDEVFGGYTGLSTKTKNLTFKEPFHEFVHCWDKYEDAQSRSESDTKQQQLLGLLTSVLEPDIRPLLDRKQDLIRERKAQFDDVWSIFTPDIEICMSTSMGHRVYQLESSQYQWDQGTVTFVLTCRNISYNGKIFGFQTTMLGIESYEGLKSLEDLEVLPLYLHSEQEDIISQTTARGKNFVDLQGWHYKSYQGIVTPADNRRRPRKIDSGRIVVDPDMYASQQGDSDRLTPLHAEPEPGSLPPPPPFDDPFAYPGDHHMNSRPRTKRRSSSVKVENTKDHPGRLEEHQYRLCTSIVKGYDMTSKQWAMFDVNGISEIKFSTAAFRRLVLPHDYKELILAFVDSHLNKEDEFDDIIEGKGRGMIVLLHGSPGLGKTLTAEAVAEEMKVPLYAMSAGQLGFDVETMEYALQDVLDICAKWGAVLLLDEADVFLEQRQLTDLQRNRLVSIFLRVLEYYPGCLFLTTNRVNTFDLAFKSRIDLSIDYPKLDFHARRHIWSTFVRASEDFPQHHSSITDDELFDLAELDLNGREVKNLVKTGRLLAKRKGESLGMTHLLSVFSVQRGLPGDGSAFRLAVPDWFQSMLGKVVVQTTMRVRRGISFN